MLAPLLLALQAAAAGTFPAPGPHAAGFTTLDAVDPSRPFDEAGTPRRVRVLVWYPARAARAAEVVFGDYVDANSGTELAAGRTRARAQLQESMQRIPGFDARALDRLLRLRVNARRDPQPAPGRYPLVLFGTGLTAPSYLYTVLAEWLATHGYVTAAVPSLPPRAGAEHTFDQRGVLYQLEDLQLAYNALQAHPSVAPGGSAVAAWSVGGVASALFAMRNPRIAAVLSLDAATGYRYGKELLEASPHFDPAWTAFAYLHIADSFATWQVAKNFEYFEKHHRGPAWLGEFPALNHSQFTSLWGWLAEEAVPGSVAAEARAAYAALCRAALAFLDYRLKADNKAGAALEQFGFRRR